MIIAGVVAAVMVFNVAFPAIVQSSDAMINMKSRIDDRLKSQIEIVHATGELDRNGLWQDTNGNNQFDVFVWVKNVGSLRINAIERADVFFGPEGNFARIPHASTAGGDYPYWIWVIENASDWNPTATLKITIVDSSILSRSTFASLLSITGLSDVIIPSTILTILLA